MRRWLIRNVLFRLQEQAKRHPTYRILSEMEATDRLSVPELEALCSARLQSFVAYCYAHVPYVKKRMQEFGLTPSQIREPRDLALLPLMRKADVRNHREDLRSDQARHLTSFSTGGSTGEPLLFDLSKRRISSRVACRQRISKWWGVSVGDPEIALWGAPMELSRQDWLRSLRDRCLSTRLLSAFDMDTTVMSKYPDIIEQSGSSTDIRLSKRVVCSLHSSPKTRARLAQDRRESGFCHQRSALSPSAETHHRDIQLSCRRRLRGAR